MIKFNKPPYLGTESEHLQRVLGSDKISGDASYGKECQRWFDQRLSCKKSLLTPSCTAALEMAAMLIDIKPGDEVIMPSYTFVSTANAFAIRGAKIVFVDIRPDTMNIDESLIEAAVTSSTKAIVPVHYAGVSCDMDTIMSIASRHDLFVIEDAAQGMMSAYRGEPLGTIGHIGTFSFHETKNYTSGGEGGLLIINDERFVQRAEILREKGTNRSQFFRGQVDKYTWVDIGSSYLPSELQAAYLWAQLEGAEKINDARLGLWNRYRDEFRFLEEQGLCELPKIPEDCTHNAHMFYLKLSNLNERTKFIEYLSKREVMSVFHYIPLHSAPAGKVFGRFNGVDRSTTSESDRLVRLPMYYGLSFAEQNTVISAVKSFFE